MTVRRMQIVHVPSSVLRCALMQLDICCMTGGSIGNIIGSIDYFYGTTECLKMQMQIEDESNNAQLQNAV